MKQNLKNRALSSNHVAFDKSRVLEKPRQPVQQLQAVEDYHDAAYRVYRAQELRADSVAEERDGERESREPRGGGAGDARDEGRGLSRRQRHVERAEHHRAVDERLRVEPRYDAGGKRRPSERRRRARFADFARLFAQQAEADFDYHHAACSQDEHLELFIFLYRRADAEEAEERERHVEEYDDERREQSAPPALRHSRIYHEKVLHSYRSDVSEAERQPLKEVVQNSASRRFLCDYITALFPPLYLSVTIDKRSRNSKMVS